MKHKIKEWQNRYLPAEIIGTISALSGSAIAYLLTGNAIITAYAGTWGENIGYYGVISGRDIIASKKRHKHENKNYNHISLAKNTRDIVLEFGPSELMDSFVTRPFLMYSFQLLTGNVIAGIFIGKIAADIVFYIPTISAYEFRKKHLKD